MKINIIAVGKLKEKYWKEAAGEYSKRLGSYCDLNIIQIPEARLHGESAAEEEAVKREEGERILAKIPSGSFVVTLEIKGKQLTSEQLAEQLNRLAIDGKSEISFIIGGSLGLSPEVCKRGNMALSFSDMTFPHQMMRVILLEQIYRSYKIIKGETYHK